MNFWNYSFVMYYLWVFFNFMRGFDLLWIFEVIILIILFRLVVFKLFKNMLCNL